MDIDEKTTGNSFPKLATTLASSVARPEWARGLLLYPGMKSITPRQLLLTCALAVFAAGPASALSFNVHGYDLGEKIKLKDGRRVWTAELDVTLDGWDERLTSFCVDLDTYIGMGSYHVRDVLDAFNDPSPADEKPRDFAWAGHVMHNYGKDLDAVMTMGVTRDQAITGVQAAIWEGIYGGGIVHAWSLSDGARDVFDTIMASTPTDSGHAKVIEMVGKQDQIVSKPVPEPSAALVFGMGLLIAGRNARVQRTA